jgi:hypothetical protein
MTLDIRADADNLSNRTGDGGMLNHVRSVLGYRPDTGVFHWKQASPNNKKLIGKVAGSASSSGYIKIKIGNKFYLAHRLAWLYMYGEWPPGSLDHIDRNPKNNAIANLRLASAAENSHNRLCLNGYWLNKDRGHFEARIMRHGKRIYLGVFPTELEARSAYEAASLKYSGEFSPYTGRAAADVGGVTC